MSKTTKRKHVLKEIFDDDFELPKENQYIVKVLASKGNNLHEVETENSEQYLVSMPTKFRKNIWVKRGDFVLVEPILEGDKVKAEIVKILSPDIVKYFKQNNVWPKRFDDKKCKIVENEDNLFVNTNRQLNDDLLSESYSETSDETDSD